VTTPAEEQNVEGEQLTFTPDWAPRLDAGVAAQLTAFVLAWLTLRLEG
jgi:hypothetical protein